MHRSKRFFTRFLLSLWIVLFGAFLFLLIFESKGGGETYPMAGVYVATDAEESIPLPNRIFTCTESLQQTQCEADVQGRPMILTLTPEDESGLNFTCQAQYDERKVSCTSVGASYAPGLSELWEVAGLNLTPQQQQTLSRKYWSLNFLQIGEVRLKSISRGLSIATGILAAYLSWFHPGRLSRIPAGIYIGTTFQGLAPRHLSLLLLGDEGFHMLMSSPLSSPIFWIIAAISLAIALGFILLLRPSKAPLARLFMALINGVSALSISSFILTIALLWSGFVD